MPPQNDLVWDDLLDNHYTVAVIRTQQYLGELTIAEGAKILYRKQVALSYNALFGPDADDVADWQQDAINFIERRGN